MTNVRKSPLLRFADNTVLDLRAVVCTLPPTGDKNFSTYTVYLSSGESFGIYTDKQYLDGLILRHMPYDDFVDAWLNCAIAS